MKFSVVGNCQSAPLRKLFSSIPGSDVPVIPANYLFKESDKERVLDEFSDSDYLIVQRVSDDYFLNWITPSYLKENYPGKVVIWPNIYFDAYYPDVNYFYRQGVGKVLGPLTDYHFDTIKSSYLSGKSVSETCVSFQNAYANDSLRGLIECSIDNLIDREGSCDVAISDYVFEHSSRQLAFYTPNHPKSFLVVELFHRIKKLLGINDLSQAVVGEMNNVVILPHPALIKNFDCAQADSYLGVELDFVGGVLKAGAPKKYSVQEMVDGYFWAYEKILGRV